MLLNDITITNEHKVAKINTFLKEKYGFSLPTNASVDKLEEAYDYLKNSLVDMKRRKMSPNDPDYIKGLLVFEGVQVLLDREYVNSNIPNRTFRKVITDLVDKGINLIRLGDTFKEAMNSLMRDYRSSIYRYNDSTIESEVSNGLKGFFKKELAEMEAEHMQTTNNEILENELQCGAEVQPILNDEERDQLIANDYVIHDVCVLVKLLDYYSDEISSSGIDAADTDALIDCVRSYLARDIGGMEQEAYDYRKEAPVNRKDREEISREVRDAASVYLKNKDSKLSVMGLEPKTDDGRQTFIHPKFIKKESIDESYIKRVRSLLESEVGQAEVLMAAKGFAKDLQEMIEKLGRLVNEDLGPVVDQMRETYGMDVAEHFSDTMRSDMDSALDLLLSLKDNIELSVHNIADGEYNSQENDMDVMPSNDKTDLSVDLGANAEFGDDFGDVSTEEPLGRPTKESVEHLRAQITEMKNALKKVKK